MHKYNIYNTIWHSTMSCLNSEVFKLKCLMILVCVVKFTIFIIIIIIDIVLEVDIQMYTILVLYIGS